MSDAKEDAADKLRADFAQAIREANNHWPHQLALISWKAKMAKARYDALRREGFGFTEALALCTKDVEL